jgi:hypothetical protein
MTSQTDLKKQLEQALKENESLKQSLAKKGSSTEILFKVSEKGGVSVYGLQRMPTTLYYEQWVRLLDKKDELLEFLEDNKAKLKMKEPTS